MIIITLRLGDSDVHSVVSSGDTRAEDIAAKHSTTCAQDHLVHGSLWIRIMSNRCASRC